MPSGASIYDDIVATPFAYVDTETLTGNIDAMARAADGAGLRLRPHAKTHKLAAIARLQLDAGAVGLTVAKIGEAEALVRAGVSTSYLVAHPFWSSAHITRFLELGRSCEVIACVDSVEGARRISDAARRAGVTARFSLVVDTGYGRFGVTPAQAPQVASAIASMPAISLTGTRSHAGHAYDAPRLEDRRVIAREDVRLMTEVAERIRASGLDLDTVSVGSTPGAQPLLELEDLGAVNEIRPGNYVFFDRMQVSLGAATIDQCALSVVTSVVSTPRPGLALLDAGKLTFSSTLDPLTPGYGLIVEHPGAEVSSLSQESASVSMNGDVLPLGARVRVIPNHACEITNLASEVYFGARGDIAGAWQPEAARTSG